MVTPAGKELLKNTINTVKLHNRILEENEMWRHWHLEKGLTMMVSDDMFRGEKSGDVSREEKKKRKKKKKHKEKHKKDKRQNKESGHSSKNDCMKVADSSADRWDHSGFEELYPESKPEVKNDSSECKRSFKEVIKKYKPCASNASPSTSYSDSSDSKEVWEEFRSSKKRKHKDLPNDRVPTSRKCDDDSDHATANKSKSNKACGKGEDCKQCESRHHHKHDKKAKYVNCRYS